MKDLIVIEGRNHYPHDLEFTVESSDRAVRTGCSAAFSVESEEGEQLVVVAEVEPKKLKDSTERLEDRVRQAVSEEHGVTARKIVLVARGAVPKTTSGKLQRQGCKRMYLEDRFQQLKHAVGA